MDLAAPQEVFESAARYFGVLAEPARLKIIHALCCEEKSVNAIMAATGMAQTNASRHLGLMYQAGVLSRRREGTQVFYRVTENLFPDLCRTVSSQIGCDRTQCPSSSPFPLQPEGKNKCLPT